VSGGQIDIRPESLQGAGRTLAQVAGQMADDVTHLQTAVTSGNPWGGDETGTVFAGVYNAVLGHALEALASYVEQTGYAAAALVQLAQDAVETDASAAGRVTDAGSGL
jgi:hypothetical protein